MTAGRATITPRRAMSLGAAMLGTLALIAASGVAAAAGSHDGSQHLAAPARAMVTRVLKDVAVVSANDAWSVGSRQATAGPTLTWVRHWNGRSWTSISSPNTSADTNALQAVDAVTSTDVWAVGVSGASRYQGFSEHWDGASWSLVDTPSPGKENALSSVAAVAADDVWAVGYHASQDHLRALIEHWNGHAWQLANAPKPQHGVVGTALTDVSAIAPDDIWAVGHKDYADGSADEVQGLFEHWDGHRWTTYPGAHISAIVRLTAVAGAAADDVWAIGNIQGGAGTHRVVFEHWDGLAWSLVSGPSPNRSSYLNDLFAVSGDDVWAVGDQNNGAQKQTTEIQHWDGVSWTVVDSPSRPHAQNVLGGIDGSSSTHLLAVGSLSIGEPLTEWWDGTNWSIGQ